MPKLAAGSPASSRGRGDLARLDEAHAGLTPSAVDEEPQEHLAVAIVAADDLLLSAMPVVLGDEFVEHGLGRGGKAGIACGVVLEVPFLSVAR